jgi:thioesterase domain-containing protein
VPAIHQAILERGRPLPLPLRFVRSGAAPLRAGLLLEIERRLGVPVIEGYGMTEAPLIASNAAPPGERRPGSAGRAAGAEIAIAGEDGRRQPPGVAGEVLVRGAAVMGGYEGDPEASRQVLEGGWLRTGDLGALDPDGFLTLTGRLKDLINRGGRKVSPRAVEEAFGAHPAVSQAVAFGVPHPRLGEDVAVAAVARAAVSEAELRGFVAERLAPGDRPTRILLVESLPAGPGGKPQRAALAERLCGRTESRPPASASEREIARAFAAVLGLESVGADEDFFALGGDSLSATRLVARLRGDLGLSLTSAVLLECPTVAGLASSARARPRGPLVPLRRPGSGRGFFCVHGLGGGAFRFARLAGRLETLPFFALQAPGFDGEEPPLDRIETLAARYLDAVREVRPGGPCLLGGFCLGAVVALEMAQRAAASGLSVERLVLIDPPPLPLWQRPRLAHRLLVRAFGLWRAYRPAAAAGGESAVSRALRRALLRYRPQRWDGPAVLVQGSERRPGSARQVAECWSRLVGHLEIERVSGHHADLFEEPAVSELAARLKRWLEPAA